MGASKPRKRRKGLNESQSHPEDAVASRSVHPTDGDGDFIVNAGEDLHLPNPDQAGSHSQDELGPGGLIVPSAGPTPPFLGGDPNLLDSIGPNSFGHFPFLGLEQGGLSTAGDSDHLMAFSGVPPFSAMEDTAENQPDNRDQLDPLMQDLSSILAESAQSNLLNPSRNDLRIHEINMPYTPPPNNTLGLPDTVRNHHDELMQMCMIHVTGERLGLTMRR